ncbi:MAG: hypothetical protein MJZ58_00350, partial [Paludibacteraceae bacterium]|nr:hypothetical protein [Paludibacteraceae bacterium]
MKKIILIIVCWLAVVCVGCSPQKRLALLLTTHPELRRDSSWVVRKDIVLPADSASIDFTFAFGNKVAIVDTAPLNQRATCASALPTTTSCVGGPNKTIVTVTTKSGATATISATDKADNYRLQVKTPTDTILLRDTITVPAYTTRVEYKDKIVHQMNNAQSFFFWLGIIAVALVVIV